ncbi:LANO_0G17062g1_1 [Lachancea nothofagi CBS 11611]|uniref:asparaginase n=1 Tax=Lachancea nothofagi CBS 11611 TaxID=1266666 RepID=A0A1G4KKG8_9SACH|nr:LANO_0G17062g1_1 [Lachancea nothofagi CBS 11611]
MPNDDIEIKTICADLESSKFCLLSSNHDDEQALSEDSGGIIKLPKIKIFGTGGTIASKGASSSHTAGYHVDLTIQQLLESIPDISGICEIDYEQLCNVDSKEIDERSLLKIYTGVSTALQTCDGIVITHGTDTLSETTFFIESSIDSGDVPIVFVGSMRPSTSVSADGPMNLYQAICIAASKQSRGRGVLVSLNDQISAGYYITKTNANSLDSFNVRQGYLGNFFNNEVHYYWPPAKPEVCHKFKLRILPNDCPDATSMQPRFPTVHILYGHQSLSPELIKLVAQQCAGLVIATMGAGSLPSAVNDVILELSIPVIYSKRSMDGMVPKANLPRPHTGSNSKPNIIASGFLNPEKSRILLQLCLFERFALSEIKNVFGRAYGG